VVLLPQTTKQKKGWVRGDGGVSSILLSIERTRRLKKDSFLRAWSWSSQQSRQRQRSTEPQRTCDEMDARLEEGDVT